MNMEYKSAVDNIEVPEEIKIILYDIKVNVSC